MVLALAHRYEWEQRKVNGFKLTVENPLSFSDRYLLICVGLVGDTSLWNNIVL